MSVISSMFFWFVIMLSCYDANQLITLILVILLQVIPKDCEQSVWKSGHNGRSNGAERVDKAGGSEG